MQLEKLKILGLYGYIDKVIDFNSDLTLLVGINGSGKTSILNILYWILKPSLPNLCVTEFKTIQLNFNYKGIGYEVLCKHNKSTFYYNIKTEKEKFHPLLIRIATTPSEIKNDEVLKENLIQSYSGLSPNQKEKKTWELISTFPNPTIIGLDRNLYTEEKEHIYIEDPARGRITRRNSGLNISPLDRVKEIVNREYRKKKNSILNLTNNLKNHLMLSTFDGSITLNSFTSGIRSKLNLTQIEDAEQRVREYFNQVEKKTLTDSEQGTIAKYFSQLKDITKQLRFK